MENVERRKLAHLDFTGSIFGLFKVLGKVPKKQYWICECSICFRTKLVRTHHLVDNFTGRNCLHNKDNDRYAARTLYGNMKYNAEKRRNHKFNIDFDFFLKITKENCYYCGIEPKQKYTPSSSNGSHMTYIFNGIDRIDNNKDYEIDNCRPCCKICNFAKRELNDIDFINHCKKIASRF